MLCNMTKHGIIWFGRDKKVVIHPSSVHITYSWNVSVVNIAAGLQ